MKLRKKALTLLIGSILALPTFSNAGTTVYKKVMPDGTVVYSDEEISGAEKLNVEPVPTVPAVKPVSEPNATTAQPAQAPYTSFEIVAPGNGSAFHSGSGTVEISVSIEPPLRHGHILKYFLDQQILAEQSNTQLIVENIDRGTHSLSVHVTDQSGHVLKSSTSTFTIHRPTARN